MHEVAVVGGSGYAGGELLRLLAGHPAAKVTIVAGARSAGADLAEVYPQLGLDGAVAPAEVDVLAEAELVFLATPTGPSLALAPALVAAGCHVVDLSAAFRLDAATFTAAYGEDHTAPGLAPAAYGLPELFRAALPGAALVAAPGCYPTAALLAAGPLVGLVDPASLVVVGMTGVTGAGRGLRDDLHAAHALGSVAAYGAPTHRHTPEIACGVARLAGLAVPPAVTFTPHLVPLARGLVATVTATLRDASTPADVRASFHDRYDDEAFVTVLAVGDWPSTAHVRGANTARVGVAVDLPANRVTASVAIDNLTKGAAGQAIQAANAVLGLPEPTGLPTAAVYP